MLFLLSPAKSLDFDTPVPRSLLARCTEPEFVPQAAQLAAVMRKKSAAQLAALMDISPALAELNAQRFAAWVPQFTPANSKPALLAFNGDVYEGLQAATLGAADLRWAQGHVLMLSGLYGALRPLDLMQPYRLEMGTAVATPHARNLYGYWADTLAAHLNRQQAGEARPVVVNLASQEYFKAVNVRALRARVVECVFEDWHQGRYKIISFFAKRARGLMARHAITQRAGSLARLKAFAAEGYAHDEAASQPERLVFRRRADRDFVTGALP